jgi:maltooligosyltrehalose trehalohydrolase
MAVDKFGYWFAEVEDIIPGTLYGFSINESPLIADPASLSQPLGVHDLSAVTDRRYAAWTDDEWGGLALKDLIIYEIHTGAFSEEGNFSGIIKKIPHLKDIGITAIELMPVAQFAGKHNWGYDGVFPFAVQHSYGGAEGLKALVNTAHEAGIAVILDVVYNHFGPEGNIINEFAPFITSKHATPWSAAINFDDSYSYGVREFFIHNALMWLDDFHIDGLRLDAVHAIIDNSAIHFLEELEEHVRILEKSSGRKKLLIAEIDGNNPRYITSKKDGGYNLDAQWNDEFHHALHALLTGEKSGYYEDFGSAEMLAKAYNDTYVFDGQYSNHRRKFFGRQTQNAFSQFVVFAQNHDHTGNRMMGERLSSLISFDALKLSAAAVIISPYIPLLFMGEEYGEENPFLYFTDFSDEALAKSVDEGRKKEFSHFGWPGEPPHPQAYDTFSRSILSWDIESGNRKQIMLLYKHLIQLRATNPAFQAPGREGLDIKIYEAGAIIMKRFSGPAQSVVILNFKDIGIEYCDNHTAYKIVLDTTDEIFGGNNNNCGQAKKQGEIIAAGPFSAVVLDSVKNKI